MGRVSVRLVGAGLWRPSVVRRGRFLRTSARRKPSSAGTTSRVGTATDPIHRVEGGGAAASAAGRRLFPRESLGGDRRVRGALDPTNVDTEIEGVGAVSILTSIRASR